jgi:hypothetical protein
MNAGEDARFYRVFRCLGAARAPSRGAARRARSASTTTDSIVRHGRAHARGHGAVVGGDEVLAHEADERGQDQSGDGLAFVGGESAVGHLGKQPSDGAADTLVERDQPDSDLGVALHLREELEPHRGDALVSHELALECGGERGERVGAGERALQLSAKLGLDVGAPSVEDAVKDGLLALVIPIERALTDLGCFADVVDGGLVVAALGEAAIGGAPDGGALLRLLRIVVVAAAAWRGRGFGGGAGPWLAGHASSLDRPVSLGQVILV